MINKVEKLKDLKNKVGIILDKCPYTRNCDVQLTLRVIQEYLPDEIFRDESTGKWFVSSYALKRVREDHVKRIRADFNSPKDSKGNPKIPMYLPTDPEVRKQRRISEETWFKFLNK